MTTSDLNEWARLRQQKEDADREANERFDAHWKEQEPITRRLRELRAQIILNHTLIPLRDWRLEMDHSPGDRIVIRHENFREDEDWKDLFDWVWPDAEYHDSIYLEGRTDYPDKPSVVLRTDDDEMRMQFSPPNKLPKFITSYGLRVVDGGEFTTRREEMVVAIASLDETLALLEQTKKPEPSDDA